MTSSGTIADFPELLAPAGDEEALRAAVANGADAVYFGLSDFNARHRATNFTLEQLPATMQYLHERGVRGYVTFNTLIFSDELPRAIEYLSAIIRAQVDAIIVQDLGIARLIQKMAPGFPVHGSTQMTLTEPRGIEFVRHLGVERVILARELSTKEIGAIRAKSALPVEVFVHGALCVAYSGQCLTSESLGGRSANRGQCAQACRQPYEMFVDGNRVDLGDKAYLLSPQDLAAYDLVDDLARLGVASLKIEGRLKSAHYVAATTQAYRAALDAARRQEPFQMTRQQEVDLAQSFSRGFTHGFLSGINHQKLVEGKFPKNRGVRIGRVTEVSPDRVTIAVDHQHLPLVTSPTGEPILPVKPGDGVVFDEGHPEQDEQGGRIFAVDLIGSRRAENQQTSTSAAPADQVLLRLTFGRGDVNFGAVAVGATLWRTDDPALRRRLERSYRSDALQSRVSLSLEITGSVGGLLGVVGKDSEGNTARVEWEQPLAAAVKHPLSRALASEQFGRLGGTRYHLADVQLLGELGQVDQLPVMVPKSVLNDLRRRLLDALAGERQHPARFDTINAHALAQLRSAHRSRSPAATKPILIPLCRTLEQLDAALDWLVAEQTADKPIAYCDFEEVRLSREGVMRGRSRGCRVGVATPRIVKPSEEGLLLQIAKSGTEVVLVRNLAALMFFRERFPSITLRGDYALNVANDLTADIFLEAGLKSLVPSYDLNLEQLQALLANSNPALFEVVLHQHMPMFHMEHCVFSHVLSNGRDFHNCGRPCEKHRVELRDHVGEAHPLAADIGCRNTLYRARPQSGAPYVPQLLSAGVRQFRVEFLRESASDVRTMLDSYARVLRGENAGFQTWHELRVLNQVGLTRGTLEYE